MPDSARQKETGRTRMALTTRRDDAAIAAGIRTWLACHEGREDPVVAGLDRPSAGYSSETVVIEVSWWRDGNRVDESLVLRMAPPEAGTLRRFDLVAQREAQLAAAGAGVPVAHPVVETDPIWLGTPFMVMPRVEGHIMGSVPHLDRWLNGQSRFDQSRLYRAFLATLAAVHRAELDDAPSVPRRDNRAELDYWAEYLDWSSPGSPNATLVEALQWCRRHRPAEEPPPTLLWGDARFENVVFGEDLSLRAVLDWDMATVGAPEHDLAWFTSLDLTMHHLFGTRIDGFPSREETIALFEEDLGRAVLDLEWYETFAMVRSTAIMTRIGFLQLEAGEPLMLPLDDNPILDLLKSRISGGRPE